MANVNPVQKLRLTSAQNAALTLPEGVLVYVTDTKQLCVHDGITPGGVNIGLTSGAQNIAGEKTFTDLLTAEEGATFTGPVTVPDATEANQALAYGQVAVSNAQAVKTALNSSGTAPIFACRAWVAFNGSGTLAILGSGNVSSVADNGVGIYTVNYASALPDANYALSGFAQDVGTEGAIVSQGTGYTRTASATKIAVCQDDGAKVDATYISLIVIR